MKIRIRRDFGRGAEQRRPIGSLTIASPEVEVIHVRRSSVRIAPPISDPAPDRRRKSSRRELAADLGAARGGGR